MKRIHIYFLSLLCLMTACEREDLVQGVSLAEITASVEPYDGETATKANVTGTSFEVGDWIRMKLICPFSPDTQDGETLDQSHNSFWLLRYNGNGSLGRMLESDGCDINGDFIASNASDLMSQRLSQQTPYVFTASTWNEEVSFYTGSSLLLHYSCTFRADQSRADGSDYKKNDLLWGQQFMQTATSHVHITFKHKMAALQITLDDSAVTAAGQDPISADAVLTLEGMPDIDQMDVVVGDYYADKDASQTAYGYWQQASCSMANNGHVIGVVVLDHSAGVARTYSMTGNPTPAGGAKNSQTWGTIANTGTYTAFHDTQNGVYRMIVPPCVLSQSPVFYLRDKGRRFKVVFTQTTFEEGKMYKFNLKVNPA